MAKNIQSKPPFGLGSIFPPAVALSVICCIISPMKQLSDEDIQKMCTGEFHPDFRAVNRSVRAALRLGRLIPPKTGAAPEHAVLDLHHKTEEQAWDAIMRLATSGARTANIITGASGILKIKFQQWAADSLLAPHIIEMRAINNGSFFVRFRRHPKTAS